ncbi:MAG: NAD(P)H-binding protein [Deltaproteobacteria bacterium]|nr:NAD(P)H-binding protein [Deltaproteobacteria bacterium]
MSVGARSLILGATGFLGLNLLDELIAAGQAPRCGHRARSNTIPLRRRGVPRVIADCAERDSIARACDGVDVVYHLAGHYPRHALDPEATLERATRELDNVIEGAVAAGVRRLVYVSSTATVARRADGRPATEADAFPARPGLGAYHDAKWAMEARALAEDRLEIVVVCPGACLGPWDLRLGTSALVIATARHLDPPHPDGVVNLVDARDVARLLAAVGPHPSPPRRVLVTAHDVGLHAFLGELAAHFGAPRPRAPLSADAAVALADAEERRVAGTPERPAIAREIVDLVVHGGPIDASLARALLPGGFRPLAETLAEVERFARRMRLIPERDAHPMSKPEVHDVPSVFR